MLLAHLERVVTTTHWACIGAPPQQPPCGAHGIYEHTAQSGDSGPAWKHMRATGHSTNTATGQWVLRAAEVGEAA